MSPSQAAPHISPGYVGVGQDLSNIVGKEAEKLVFIGSQVQFLPVQAGAPRRIVNGQPSVGKQGGLYFLQGLHIA